MSFLWYLEKLIPIYIEYIYVTKKEGFSLNCGSYYIHIVLNLEKKKKKEEKATSNRRSITLNIWHFHFSCHLVGNVNFCIIYMIMSVAYFWSVNSPICAMSHFIFSGYNTLLNHFSLVKIFNVSYYCAIF